MGAQPKFNFIPERQIAPKSGDIAYRVSIYPKDQKGSLSYNIIFPREVVDIYELNGKYIRLYGDKEKQTIGWSIISGNTNLEELNDARLLKQNSNGVCIVSITKLIKSFDLEFKDPLKKIEVKLYKSLLIKDDINYINLKEALLV